jgi:hypothetical protein
MAQGDVVIFHQFYEDMGDGLHDLSSASIWVALCSDTLSIAMADPRWGAGGGTNLTVEEVNVAGNYASGGISAGTADNWTQQTSQTCAFDLSDISWAQNASNPADALWAAIYNFSNAGKHAIGAVDLGGVFDMTTGDLSITWNAAGVFTLA